VTPSSLSSQPELIAPPMVPRADAVNIPTPLTLSPGESATSPLTEVRRPIATSRSVVQTIQPTKPVDLTPPPRVSVTHALHEAFQWVNAPVAQLAPEASSIVEVQSPRHEESSPRAAESSSKAAASPATTPPTVEIGVIDVHVHPPTSPARRERAVTSTTPLARGYSSRVGLRQG
jgi:hypothetical protein